MALKQCPECKQELSETAKVCPHCGFKKPPAVSPAFAAFLILVVCGIAAVAIMVVVQIQQANRAQAQFDETARRGESLIRAYKRSGLLSSTPTPSAKPIAPAYESRQTKAAAQAPPPPPPPQFVTITQPVSVGSGALPAGTPFVGSKATFYRGISARSAVLPVGTRLDFVSQVGGSQVLIRYKGGEYMIPVSATDLK